MFYVRFLIGLMCVLGLLMAITLKTHEQQRTHTNKITSGTVKIVPNQKLQRSIDKLSLPQEHTLRHRAQQRAPVGMYRKGRYEPLSGDQRRSYAILATFLHDEPSLKELMLRIAACESSFRHTLPDGRVNSGPDGHDKGIFMVRHPVHAGELRRYGLDLTDFAHNTVFAKLLLERDGPRHWNASRSCWETVRFHWQS